jgi:hypothetical protein
VLDVVEPLPHPASAAATAIRAASRLTHEPYPRARRHPEPGNETGVAKISA